MVGAHDGEVAQAGSGCLQAEATMNELVKVAADQSPTERKFTEHDFAWLELRAARAYLERRVQIAMVKTEHGLLTEDEQDALVLEAAELREAIELWRQYR
jgi:hypothetical protein